MSIAHSSDPVDIADIDGNRVPVEEEGEYPSTNWFCLLKSMSDSNPNRLILEDEYDSNRPHMIYIELHDLLICFFVGLRIPFNAVLNSNGIAYCSTVTVYWEDVLLCN